MHLFHVGSLRQQFAACIKTDVTVQCNHHPGIVIPRHVSADCVKGTGEGKVVPVLN
jgi:hypothetical protein